MATAAVIASVLVALVAAASGVPKALSAPAMIEEAEHLGLSRSGYVVIGSLELAAAVGLLVGLAVAPLGIAAAAGLVLMMIGAVVMHVRAGDPLAAMAPAIVVGAATALVLGLLIATT